MTPRYTWTPASEPPDSAREVCVWCLGQYWTVAYYSGREWRWWTNGNVTESVTHWRDVEPPEAGQCEERFTLRQISDACIAVEIEESKYESLLLELDALKLKGAEAVE